MADQTQLTTPAPQGQPQQWGMTPPISVAGPTLAEEELTKQLIDCLEEHGMYESPEEGKLREQVLLRLNDLFKEFVRRVIVDQGGLESHARESGGKIYTFGSYRLGVHGRNSDIDTLCVAPKQVSRDDFFREMPAMLKAIPEITEITAIPDAFVPMIGLQFSGIAIDLLFAQLNKSSVPDDQELFDDNLLTGLDDRDIRSLNGSRVTDQILRLVPNIQTFRTALRCIKLWAKQRAIYSNVMGFFGGVAWAIVVARVCQLYPNVTASVLVAKFFRIMQSWEWPHPVILKQIEESKSPTVRVWNPRIYYQDKAHRMPIITPAYPSMCSTHNVTSSTQAVTIEEMGRAANIAERVLAGSGKWEELFEKTDFFQRYKYYVVVVASSDDQERQLKWQGLVESKLRQLVMKLEVVESIERAHPFIKGIEKVNWCLTEIEELRASHGISPPQRDLKQYGIETTEDGKPIIKPTSSAATEHTAQAVVDANQSLIINDTKDQQQKMDDQDTVVDPSTIATTMLEGDAVVKTTSGDDGTAKEQAQTRSVISSKEESSDTDAINGKSTIATMEQAVPDDSGDDAAMGSGGEETCASGDKKKPRPIFTTAYYVGMKFADPTKTTEGNGTDATGGKSKMKIDISWPTQSFMTLVKDWDRYEPEHMGIVVSWQKGSRLPQDLVGSTTLKRKRI